MEEELIFYVPNTFTPDDDKFNQTFKPVFYSGYDPLDYTMLIFNRWGEIIWESNDVDVGWDGTYSGQTAGGGFDVQDGTYTWRIEFKKTANDELVIGSFLEFNPPGICTVLYIEPSSGSLTGISSIPTNIYVVRLPDNLTPTIENQHCIV